MGGIHRCTLLCYTVLLVANIVTTSKALVTTSVALVTSSDALVTSSFFLLVIMAGATSSVLAPSSDALRS